MQAPRNRLFRGLLITIIYLMGFFGIVASGGGGGSGSIEMTGVTISTRNFQFGERTSSTYGDTIYLSGRISFRSPGDGEFTETISVTWRNLATGESESDQWTIEASCTYFNIHNPGELTCFFSGKDGFHFTIPLELGSNKITVKASMQGSEVEASTFVERTLPFPSVETSPASEIGAFEATLNGEVNPSGEATEAWFEYSTDQGIVSPNSTPIKAIGTVASKVSVSETIQNLAGSTTYFYRLVARNTYGTVFGEIQSFTTQDATVPVVRTLQPTFISGTSARLSGEVDSNGDDINAWFEWGTDSALNTSTTTNPKFIPHGSPTTTIDDLINSLNDGMDYYYRIVASNGTGTTRGNILSFTTPVIPRLPTINLSAPVLFPEEATLSGTVNPNRTDTNAFIGIGFDSVLSHYTTRSPDFDLGAGNSLVSVEHLFAELSSGTKYNYRLYASNVAGGADQEGTFTTPLGGYSCWVKAYRPFYYSSGTDSPEQILSINKTSDNGFMILTRSPKQERVIKLNSEGGSEWVKEYTVGGSQHIDGKLTIIKQTVDGFLGAGTAPRRIYSGGIQYFVNHLWVGKFNQNGNGVWQRAFGRTDSPTGASFYPTDIEILGDGFVIGGEGWVMKLDNAGNEIWRKSSGGKHILVTTNGFVVVGDQTGNAGSSDIRVSSFDKDGSALWANTYGSPDNETANAAAVSGNEITIAGTVTGSDGTSDVMVLSLNENGGINWQYTIGGASNDSASGLRSTLDNGYILGGMTSSFHDDTGAWLLKLSNTGNVEWQKVYAGNILENYDNIRQLSDGGYIAGTKVDPYEPNTIKLIRTDSAGNCYSLGTDTSAIPVLSNLSVAATISVGTFSPLPYSVIYAHPNERSVAVEQIAP